MIMRTLAGHVLSVLESKRPRFGRCVMIARALLRMRGVRRLTPRDASEVAHFGSRGGQGHSPVAGSRPACHLSLIKGTGAE